VPEELLDALHRRLGGVDVLESYGLTEGGANVLTPRWGIHKLGSTGLPVPGVELRVVTVGDPFRECEPGEVGELWTRSTANLIGYLKQPDVTEQRLLPDGWLKTGDLVRRDEQGYVYFVGRVDDMINVGGENVYPKEVETVLLEHEDVVDVAVVAAPHAVKGEAPVAWVVPRNSSLTEEDVKQWFLARGPAYAHPRRVFFLDRLPVTGTNKIDRKHLQEEALRLAGASSTRGA
jgi:acyl-CoA synthetase (AMP-forming)/AMP-acid ligase II